MLFQIPDSVAQINKQHDVHENYPIESQNNPPVIMRKPPSRRNKVKSIIIMMYAASFTIIFEF